MKKLLAISLSLLLVLALSACDYATYENYGLNSNPVGSEQQGSENGQSSPVSSSVNTKISRDRAIEIALEKAGVKREDVRDLEADLDKDPDGLFWEVDFEVGNKEYDYDINAETGEIFDNGARPTESAQKITRDQAIEKALSNAGLKKENVRGLEAELDKEHGGTYWEVDFESGNMEYSYDINAETGEILKVEKEFD